MLLQILGWFWIITGLIFWIHPDKLCKKLQRKGRRKVQWFFIVTAVTVGLMLLGAAWQQQGLAAKVAFFLAILAVIKAIMLINGKVAAAMADWLYSQPVPVLRGFAVVQILIGAVLVLM